MYIGKCYTELGKYNLSKTERSVIPMVHLALSQFLAKVRIYNDERALQSENDKKIFGDSVGGCSC